MNTLCKNGDLEGVQQLLQLNPKMDMSIVRNASYFACNYGHLELAQWLLLQAKPTMDISDKDKENIYCWNKANAYLKYKQWLQQLKIFRRLMAMFYIGIILMVIYTW